jgi:AcrR family transcriptional regulator
MQAARKVIATWANVEVADDRVVHVRTAARAEFGRRGYEATTIRDIAAAAGLSTGTVYRMFSSKDELLLSIMESYSDHFATAWDAVVRSGSSPLEQLDALMWVNINILDRFSEEFNIQLAWLRQSPPATLDLGLSLGRQLQQLKALLAAGAKAGEVYVEGATADARARSLYELMLTPENVVRTAGTRQALSLARDAVLRGAAPRSS